MRKCRVCGCTDDDCRQCIQKTGEPCYWVEADLCSACQNPRNVGFRTIVFDEDGVHDLGVVTPENLHGTLKKLLDD
jgi:hypothetical protein